jgi:hypothetical protein
MLHVVNLHGCLSWLKSYSFCKVDFFCGYCCKVVAIASAALDGFKNESKKMVVALVDMERVFVPPQHFIRLVQRRY